MKIFIDKEIFFNQLSIASRIISEKNITSPILQGVYLAGEKNNLSIYSSNLNIFFYSKIKAELNGKITLLIEPRKVLDFLSFLLPGKIEIEIFEKKIIITQQKTKGSFSLLNLEDFPLPPKIDKEGQKIDSKTFKNNLSQILFSAAKDETRPVLAGVNFVTNNLLTMVTTDGFRLSLVKIKKQINHPPFIVSAGFIDEVIKLIKNEEIVEFFYLNEEKTVAFKVGENILFSRLIEGEFPPFEKVIPEKYITRATVDKEELMRAIKLISVFARDFSNVVVLVFNKNEIIVRPKTKNQENKTIVEAKIEGEEQTVAFNYRFLLDFIAQGSAKSKNIIIEILRSDAPVVFRNENQSNYLHIIMPVRIQEE